MDPGLDIFISIYETIAQILNENQADHDFDRLWWMYSTIAQTLGAIIAVVGMITVYKLDRIGNSIGRIFDRIYNFATVGAIDFARRGDLLTMGPEKWIFNYRELWPNNPKFNEMTKELKFELDTLTNAMEKEEQSRIKIKKTFVFYFLIPNFVTILGAVGGLFFSDFYLHYKCFVYTITFELFIYCLIVTFILSRLLLGYTKKQYQNWL